MRKLILSSLFVALSLFSSVNAQEKTVLSAQIYGYKGDMVYFDCVQSPAIAAEFYTNPGEEHLYSFDSDRLVCMLINGKTKVLLQPGDSLHVNISYDGNNIQNIEYSGDENAVKTNKVIYDIDNLRRDMRYKTQLLACVAVDVAPKDRIEASRSLHGMVKKMLDEAKLPADAANYILSLVESDVYLSFMEYPVMYASVRGKAVELQEIGDYWHIMDGFASRTDVASLSCPEYAGLLMRYCIYANEKSAKEQGKTYTAPVKLETMYDELAAFYTGAQREFVLYTLLCNFIQKGQEIERADALYNDYKEKYNPAKRYTDVLDMILQ